LATPKLTAVVIDALEDIKAKDIVVIDVRKLTSVFDYIAVASADSTRQTKALARHVMDKTRETGGYVVGIEGEDSGEWVLVDCGDVVVHIMQPAVREHYQLESLWDEGKKIFPAAPRKKPVAKPTAARKSKPKTAAKKKPAAKPKTAAKPPKKKPALPKSRAATAKATTTRNKKAS
jgi:ribosome-associated protein